jgi:hypothetical protein
MALIKGLLIIISIMGILFEQQQKYADKIEAGARKINMVLWLSC